MMCTNGKPCYICEDVMEGVNPNNPKARKVCRVCDERMLKRYARHTETNNRYTGVWRMINKNLIRSAKERVRHNGREFDITAYDILDVWPRDGLCPALGIELTCAEGHTGDRTKSPSLDRIDSSKGYIRGNIQVISMMANRIKTNANAEQVMAVAQWMGVQDDVH